jgi:DNA-binding beta-propeller fold protein YncE
VDTNLSSSIHELSGQIALKATTSYLNAQISLLVNGADPTLDTLGEIAAVLTNNVAVTGSITTALGTKANQTDVTALAATLSTKATQSGLVSLSAVVGTKADSTTVSTLSTAIVAVSATETTLSTDVSILKATVGANTGNIVAVNGVTLQDLSNRISELYIKVGFKNADGTANYTLANVGPVIPGTVSSGTLTIKSTFGSSGTVTGQFNNPNGVAIDAVGNIYVVDSLNHRVQKFTSTGSYISQFGSGQSNQNGQFNTPIGIAIDAFGNIYVVDQNNHRVQKFSSTGTYLSQLGTEGSDNGQFNYPTAIAIDATGNIYVVDLLNYRVQKFNSLGNFVSKFGSQGNSIGQFGSLHGIAIDASGNIWVSDTGNNRIQKFSSEGTYLSQIGTGTGSPGSADGQFNNPRGIAIDAAGKIVVSDRLNNRIQLFTNAGVHVSKLIGQDNPTGVAIDASGNIVVAGNAGNRILING